MALFHHKILLYMLQHNTFIKIYLYSQIQKRLEKILRIGEHYSLGIFINGNLSVKIDNLLEYIIIE